MGLPEQRFADDVVQFVELCEAHENVRESAEYLYRSLTELMRLVLHLPKEDQGDATPEDPNVNVSEEECRRVRSRANSVIEKQFYDHTSPDGSVTTGDTTNDLAEIYHDLKLGLLVWQRGGEQDCAAAVRRWRFSHGSHWGAHASGLCSSLKDQVRRTGIENAVLLEGEDDFFAHLLARRQEWRPFVSRLPAGPDENWSAVLLVPSPTGDPVMGITLCGYLTGIHRSVSVRGIRTRIRWKTYCPLFRQSRWVSSSLQQMLVESSMGQEVWWTCARRTRFLNI